MSKIQLITIVMTLSVFVTVVHCGGDAFQTIPPVVISGAPSFVDTDFNPLAPRSPPDCVYPVTDPLHRKLK